MKKTLTYDIIEDSICDVLSDSQIPMFAYKPQTSENDLKMLSLFSGCGGMDIGFEGGFICHKKSIYPKKKLD